MDSETRISIYITPPQEIADKIQAARQKVGVFYTSQEDSKPHITLYACRFDETKYPLLLEQLRTVVAKPFSLTLSELEVTRDSKYKDLFVSFKFRDMSELIDLHHKVLAIANPLRGDLIRFKDTERLKKGVYSPERFAEIEKWGYEWADKYFEAHITVGELYDTETEKLESLKHDLTSLAGTQFAVDSMYAKYSKRSIPEDKKTFESEITEIRLGGL